MRSVRAPRPPRVATLVTCSAVGRPAVILLVHRPEQLADHVWSRSAVLYFAWILFVAAAPLSDLLARRSGHPVSLSCGLALLLSAPLRFALAQGEPWHRVATGLIRWSPEAHY